MSTPFLSKRYTLKFCTQVHVYPETWPPRRLFSVFSAEYIWSYFLRILFTYMYTCLNVSRKSVESLTTLGVAHAGRHASFFAVFGCVDDKFSRTYRGRLPQNINVWRTSMATGQVGVQLKQSNVLAVRKSLWLWKEHCCTEEVMVVKRAMLHPAMVMKRAVPYASDFRKGRHISTKCVAH